MTARELREFLAGVPDDVEVLASVRDGELVRKAELLPEDMRFGSGEGEHEPSRKVLLS